MEDDLAFPELEEVIREHDHGHEPLTHFRLHERAPWLILAPTGSAASISRLRNEWCAPRLVKVRHGLMTANLRSPTFTDDEGKKHLRVSAQWAF
jgi:hypothetical protein